MLELLDVILERARISFVVEECEGFLLVYGAGDSRGPGTATANSEADQRSTFSLFAHFCITSSKNKDWDLCPSKMKDSPICPPLLFSLSIYPPFSLGSLSPVSATWANNTNANNTPTHTDGSTKPAGGFCVAIERSLSESSARSIKFQTNPNSLHGMPRTPVPFHLLWTLWATIHPPIRRHRICFQTIRRCHRVL